MSRCNRPCPDLTQLGPASFRQELSHARTAVAVIRLSAVFVQSVGWNTRTTLLRMLDDALLSLARIDALIAAHSSHLEDDVNAKEEDQVARQLPPPQDPNLPS